MKRNNNKGFTLAELLIVVAIIAVLVAIAIPVFTSQLEKSREATDTANIRSKYAEVMTQILTDDKTDLTAEVSLKQGVSGWQNAENWSGLNALNVTENAASGIMGVTVDNTVSTGVGTGAVVSFSYDADGGTSGLGKLEIKIG